MPRRVHTHAWLLIINRLSRNYGRSNKPPGQSGIGRGDAASQSRGHNFPISQHGDAIIVARAFPLLARSDSLVSYTRGEEDMCVLRACSRTGAN